MQLMQVRITNFRSITDSGKFSVDSVTCLVGKNEAGKSALLLALAALNPSSTTPVNLDVERDYPRSKLIEYKNKKNGANAPVVWTKWKLSGTEVEAISQKVGEGVLVKRKIKITKCYQEDWKVDVGLNERRAIDYLLEKFQLDPTQIEKLQQVQTIDELVETLNQLQDPSNSLQEIRDYLKNEGNLHTQISKIIGERLPTFLYFSSYDRMDGEIQIEQARQLVAESDSDSKDRNGIRLFVEFLEYAGIPMDEIVNEQTYETFDARLQGASNDITDQVLEYWSQNPDIEVNVRIENARPGDIAPFNAGTIARARIKNNLHRVETPFSERSAGFVWFFSFLIKFAKIKHERNPVILLLDEPGLSLHGVAQGELLRFFDEKLAPHHQLVYTTHSPFMVPSDKFDKVRIVEDKVRTKNDRRLPVGTKVTSDVLLVDADSMFPLQGALGIQALQTLFVGENTLLVEGPSDILYLQVLSEVLEEKGRVGLDPRWTLCPSGGIDNILPFISLFKGKGVNVAVLSDRATDKKNVINRITKSNLLQAGHFYTIADFLELEEADIEDIFGPHLYADIVNSCYKLNNSDRIMVDRLNELSTELKLVKKIEKLFEEIPIQNQRYYHYKPAMWLNRNPDLLHNESVVVNRALELAETMFDTYNKLLS